MKQGYQCDFCTEFSEILSEIVEHEKKCAFNPCSKKCWTCSNRTQEGAPISGFWNGCSAGVDQTTQFSVEEGDIVCDKWEHEGGEP